MIFGPMPKQTFSLFLVSTNGEPRIVNRDPKVSTAIISNSATGEAWGLFRSWTVGMMRLGLGP